MMAVHRTEDLFGRFFDYHRRAERQLAALGSLPVHLEHGAVEPAACAIACGALSCFGEQMPAHHREEEREMLPLLLRGAVPGTRAHLRAVRARLQADHGELMRTWRELRRPLGAIAEGLWRPVPETTLTYFRVIWSLHICVEESAVYSIARHRLAPPERAGPAARGGDRVTEPSLR